VEKNKAHPFLKKLMFDLKEAELKSGHNDLMIVEGDDLKTMLNGFERAFGSSAGFVLFESGKYAGVSFVSKLIEAGVKKDEVVFWFREFFNDFGWGKICYSDKRKKGEIIIKVEDCVEVRQTKSTKPVCHFILGFISGIYESLLQETTECTEVLCLAKGDPHCEFKVTKLLRSKDKKMASVEFTKNIDPQNLIATIQ
jgi:bacteriochlorophyll 4-vinyl reductase